jgi:hypothetical protein
MADGPLRRFYSNLSRLDIAGVKTGYDLDNTPEFVPDDALPCTLPLLVQERAEVQHFSSAESGSVTGANVLADFTLGHVMLYKQILFGGVVPTDWNAAIVDLIDAYLYALGADPTLGDTLIEGVKTSVFPGPIEWGGKLYAGARLWHRALIEYVEA